MAERAVADSREKRMRKFSNADDTGPLRSHFAMLRRSSASPRSTSEIHPGDFPAMSSLRQSAVKLLLFRRLAIILQNRWRLFALHASAFDFKYIERNAGEKGEKRILMLSAWKLDCVLKIS